MVFSTYEPDEVDALVAKLKAKIRDLELMIEALR